MTEEEIQKLPKLKEDLAVEEESEQGGLLGQLDENAEGLFINYAQSKKQRKQMWLQKELKDKDQKTIFMKSIRQDVTEEQFKEAFSSYGKIVSVKL